MVCEKNKSVYFQGLFFHTDSTCPLFSGVGGKIYVYSSTLKSLKMAM